MKRIVILRATSIALLSVFGSGAALSRQSTDTPPDTLCTVLGTAARYVGTTVTVRGVALTDGRVTSLSDATCKGSIALQMDEQITHKRDISAFRRAVATKGARADATIFGRFRATGDSQAPYAIDVFSVKDIVESPVVADGS